MRTEKEFLRIISERFVHAFKRIFHALDQLNEEQIWYRPSVYSNSVGIILQHLIGNLNQWISSGIGEEEFHRMRSKEFFDETHLTAEELITHFNSTKLKILEIISQIPADHLLSERKIQGFDNTIMSALINAISHLELHGGQIMYITKFLLGDRYKVSWIPANTEQGK